MSRFTLVTIYLLSAFFINSYKVFSQNFIADTSRETSSFHNAVNLYHRFLSPERGLYDGSEYTYGAYYPFIINEGHPFFQSKNFDTGAVFYNNVLYENVSLLFDIVKEELLINDPSHIYIIKLNTERIGWFIISGHTFVRLIPGNTNNIPLNSGFYDLLYNGNITLFKKVSKTLKENSASGEGINEYAVESDEYFIKKNNQYYKVKNKKSLMPIMNNSKKEVEQFIRKNKLNLKKNMDYALTKIVAYYDGINNNNKKADN